MWYVVQVKTGQELATCELIRRVTRAAAQADESDEGVLEECFVPMCELERKYHGEWRRVPYPLFPGYLIAVSDRVGRLSVLLRAIPEFTRMLTVGESFAPLEDADREWISTFSDETRTVRMSRGVMEGDRVIVTDGPLRGREALIAGVNRSKGLAYLELHMFGRTLRTRIGLAIVSRTRESLRQEALATALERKKCQKKKEA